MKSDQNKAYGNYFRKVKKVPYWKVRKVKSELKKQNAVDLNANDNKSVDTNSNNQKNYKGNKQKCFGKD